MTEIIQQMTVPEAQAWKSRVGTAARQLRQLLYEGYERAAWEALGFSSWTDCVKALAEEFSFTENYLWRLHTANKTEKLLDNCQVNECSIPEGQLRALSSVPADSVAQVYQEAVDTAPNGKVTAAHIADTVKRLAPRPQPTDSVHFSSKSVEHYTPQRIIDAALAVLGQIDLDPCSNSLENPHMPALDHFTVESDGLAQPWFGRIYMNPPYGTVIGEWTAKLAAEYESGNVTEAIALVPGRIDTQWWQALGKHYHACFITGRLTFIGNADPAPFPSTVFYLGENVAAFYDIFSALGQIWKRLDENWFTE